MGGIRLFGIALLALSLLLAQAGLAAAQETVTVPLTGQGSGTCTLTAASPTTTTVACNVSGLTPNTSLTNHIHSGTCASPGAVVHSTLANLQTDAQGNASNMSTLNVPLSDLSGLIIIAPHVEPGGTPQVCGTIPAVAAAPGATPTVAAPVAAPAAAAPAVAGGPAPLVVSGILGALGLFALGGSLFLRRR